MANQVSGIKTQNPNNSPFVFKVMEIRRIEKDVLVVQGLARGSRLLSTKQRNMVVIHNEAELTLVNPIRLRLDDEDSLLKIGRITRIIRLGPALDGSELADQYYQKVFGARLYHPGKASSDSSSNSYDSKDVEDVTSEQNLEEAIIDESTILPPIPRSRFFLFHNTVQPEAALLVNNILITSECLQAHQNNKFVTEASRAVMQLRGHLDDPIVIKPRWRKQMQGDNHLWICDDFERLLKLHFFNKLIGASGSIVSSGGRDKVAMAVKTAFPIS